MTDPQPLTDADLDVLVQRDGLEMVLRGAYLGTITITPEQTQRLEALGNAQLEKEKNDATE